MTSLDFQMLDNVARVIIGVKGAEDIQHNKNENLIVVGVPTHSCRKAWAILAKMQADF